jgi:hypothetical protein
MSMSRVVPWLVALAVIGVFGFVGAAVYREQSRSKDRLDGGPTAAPRLQSQPIAAEAVQTESTPPVAENKRMTWPEVEAQLDILREKRKSDPGATLDLSTCYMRLAKPAFTHSADYPAHIAELEKYRDEFPESPTPLVALAAAYVNWGWEARGTGYAGTVSEEGWRLLRARAKKAHELLDQAIKLELEDGEAYNQYILVGMAEGATDAEMRNWFDAGRKLDPKYVPIYRQMAITLMPRWGGAPGDVERFAAEVTDLLPGEDGLEIFAHVAFVIHLYECDDPTTILWGQYDRKLLAQAADVFAKRHPSRKTFVQFAALCSMVCQDHALAQRIRPLVGEFDQNDKVFFSESTYEQFLEWAAAETIPGGEEPSFWATLDKYADLSFADDPRYLWVGHQSGARSVTLMDSHSSTIEFELPHPGGFVNHTLFDNDRKQLLLAAHNGPLVGWMLFDFAMPAEPIRFDTHGPVRAIALNPQQQQVAWSEAYKVRLRDLTAEERKTVDIQLSNILELKFSPDGKLLAAGSNIGWSVLESATGRISFKLPSAYDKPAPKLACKKVFDIDEQGRIWAIAISSATNPEYSLARFSADGKKSELLLANLGFGERAVLSLDRRLLAITRPTETDWGPCAIDVYDVTQGRRIKQLGGHWNPIGDLRFSADGKKLASIAKNADVIKIWSLEATATEAPTLAQ